MFKKSMTILLEHIKRLQRGPDVQTLPSPEELPNFHLAQAPADRPCEEIWAMQSHDNVLGAHRLGGYDELTCAQLHLLESG